MATSSTFLSQTQTLFSCSRVYPTHSNAGRGSYFPPPLHLGHVMPRCVPLICSPPRSSVIAFLRPRRGRESRLAPKRPPPKNKTALDDFMKEEEQEYIGGGEEEEEEEEEGEEEDEEYPELDVLNDFFAQLEKDINNHELSDDDLEIDEEDLLKFEKELTQALGEAGVNLEEGDSDSEGVDEEDNWIQLPELKTWQMRKLARALKLGRRKTNIKKLSEDVGLDRTTVLEFLRNPPPNLLLMSDSLPDEPSPQAFTEPENSELNSSILTDGSDIEPDETEPVESKETKPEVKQQVRRGQFPPQKRLKKGQVETLERVYYKTKRPTNEMISSIVHVTNLPRKVILNWFEEKREQDGIPQEPIIHARYKRRSVTKTSFR